MQHDLKLPHDDQWSLDIFMKHEEGYQLLQNIAIKKYEATYGAKTSPAPDLFVCFKKIREEQDLCGSCYGITSAASKKLFAENYLDKPVELVVKEKFHVDVSRQQIAEIGPGVSCQSRGSGAKLMSMMPWLFWSLKFDYVMATATKQMRDIFENAHIAYFPIVAATEDRVKHVSAGTWGSYYEQSPITGVIDIKLTIYRWILHGFVNKFNLSHVDIHHKISHHNLMNA